MRVSEAQSGTEGGTVPARKKGRKTEADRTAGLAATLPKGISLGQWGDARPKPFYVRFGAKRTIESYASEQERNDRAEKLAQDREQHGTEAFEVNMSEWRAWQDFRRRCAAPLHVLEELWRKHEATRGRTLGQASERYMATWKGDEPSYRHVKLHMKRLVERMGPLPLAEVGTDLIQDFVDQLADPETGKPMSAVTKIDHRKNWNRFFYWCVVQRWISSNPCELLVLETPIQDDREILTARQVFDLLKANRDQPVIGRMAFELFGALRASSAARLAEDDVKRESKGVRLPGSKHKSLKTKFRQGHPDVLWAWYDHAKATMWQVTTGVYDERKREAFIRAGFENKGNVLRSSFATYMLALTNDPGRVARLMQHTSLKMLEIYEGFATEADAKLVMAMTPEAVRGTWEEFVSSRA